MPLSKYKKLADEMTFRVQDLERRKTKLNNEYLASCDEYEATCIAHQTMQKVASVSQEKLSNHLSKIVTQAIQVINQEPYEFMCEFVERRGQLEADLYLTKGDKKYDIIDGVGGGVADVCSFALKVAYLLLSDVSKVLIIDEVSRHVNGEGIRERFAQVLRKLTDDFNMQIILNTNAEHLLEICDEVHRVKLKSSDTSEVIKER